MIKKTTSDIIIIKQENKMFLQKAGKIISEGYDTIIEERYNQIFYTIKSKKVGLIKQDGTVLLENKYIQILPNFDRSFDIRTAKGLGIATQEHGEIIPAKYEKIKKINDHFYEATNNSIHSHIYSYKGKLLLKETQKHVEDGGDNTVIAGGFNNFLYGFYEEEDEVKTAKFNYKKIFAREHGHYLAYTTNGLQVLLNSQFQEVIEPQEELLKYTGDDTIGYLKDGKYGLSDLNHTTIIQPTYDFIYPEVEGCIVAQKGEKYGIINRQEDILLPFEFDMLSSLINGCALSFKDGETGYVDLTNTIYTLKKQAGENHVYYRDQNGNLGPKKTPNELQYVFENSCEFTEGDKSGWIDGDGNIILDAIYDEVSYVLFGDLGFVKQDEKWAFFDREKGFVTDFIYDEAGFLMSGYGLGKIEQKMALVTKDGQITPCTYKSISYRQTLRTKYVENKGWLTSPGSSIAYSAYLNCWMMNDQYTERRTDLTRIDDIVRTNYTTGDTYIETSDNNISLDGKPYVNRYYEIEKDLTFESYSIPKIPEEIIATKINTLKNKVSVDKLPDYNDSGQRNIDYFDTYQPEYIAGIKGLQQQFLMGFVAAASQWLYYRFDDIIEQSLNKKVLFMKLDAIFASSVSPRYCRFSASYNSRVYIKSLEAAGIETTEDEESRVRFLNYMVNEMHYLPQRYRQQSPMMFQEIASYIFSIKFTLTASKQKLYLEWVANVIAYGKKHFPTRYKEEISNQTVYNTNLDDIVSPHIYFDLTRVLSKEDHEKEMKAFLDNLDWSQSPYLVEDEYKNARPLYVFE